MPGAFKQLLLSKETTPHLLKWPCINTFPSLIYIFKTLNNSSKKRQNKGSLSLPWVLAPEPASPRCDSKDSLRGDRMGVSVSGVSKLPSESELPRGKNEELPLSTVFPTPLYRLHLHKVQYFLLTLQPARGSSVWTGPGLGEAGCSAVAATSSGFRLPEISSILRGLSPATFISEVIHPSDSPPKAPSTDSFSHKSPLPKA